MVPISRAIVILLCARVKLLRVLSSLVTKFASFAIIFAFCNGNGDLAMYISWPKSFQALTFYLVFVFLQNVGSSFLR